MPTNVTGNPTGVAAPAVLPGPDTFVVTAQPIAGEGATVASVNQAFTALGNEQAWEKKPTAATPASPAGLDAAYVQPVKAWRNVKGQRRSFIDHRGNADLERVTRWHEFWDQVEMVSKSSNGSGPWAGRWNYSINVGSGAPVIQRGTWSGIPTPPDYPGGTLTLDTGNVTSASLGIALVEADPLSGLWLNDDSDIVVQFEGEDGGTSNAETVWGLTQQSMLGTSALFTATNPIGMAFIRRNGDTNIHFYYYPGTGSPTIIDTGVATASRYRIEYQGVNAADDGTARILLYMDGGTTPKKNIPVDFTPTLPTAPTFAWPFIRLTSQGGRPLAWFGAVDFAGPRWPGDIAY